MNQQVQRIMPKKMYAQNNKWNKTLILFLTLICFSFSVDSKDKSKNLPSSFKVALDNAKKTGNKKFYFTNKRGKTRYYKINDGEISEITTNNFGQPSPYKIALDNAKKTGNKEFEFTNKHGKKRYYEIVGNKITETSAKVGLAKIKPKKRTAVGSNRTSARVFKDSENNGVKLAEKLAVNIEKNSEKKTISLKDLLPNSSINTDEYKVRPKKKKSPLNIPTKTDYTFNIGTRLWISEGETEFAHCASVACGGGVYTIGAITGSLGDPTSKLEYTSMRNRVFELTSDFEVHNIFLQAKIGLKSNGDTGKFRDFDWITHDATGVTYEFSDTISPVKDVDLNYSIFDVGYKVDMRKYFKGANFSVTPFIGYVRYNERAKAYGIYDLPDDFSAGTGWSEALDGVLVLQNEIFWSGSRFGVEIDWEVNPKTNFLANVAYLENVEVRNEDSHVLRADLGPTPNVISTGDGRGWMIDLIGKYAYNNNLGFELGYRFWRFEDRNVVNTFGPDFASAWPVRQLYSQRQGFIIGVEYSF
jgi:hypothetical protein